jgi:hypothetical protein
MTTADLFNIKKNPVKDNQCEAMRCKDAPQADAPGELWGKESNVFLCARHISLVLTYLEQRPDYSPTEQAATEVATEVEVEAEVVADVVAESRPESRPESDPSTAIRSAQDFGIKVPVNWTERAFEIVAGIVESYQEAKDLGEQLAQVPVESHEDLEFLSDCLRDVKTKRNATEAEELEITGPLTNIVKRIRELIKPAKYEWSELERALRSRISQTVIAEAERNQELLQAAAQAHADGEDATELVRQTTVSTDLAGVGVKLIWVAIVDDVSKLPDEYVIRKPDMQKLKSYVAGFSGEAPMPLPGVRFVQDAPLRVRSN